MRKQHIKQEEKSYEKSRKTKRKEKQNWWHKENKSVCFLLTVI
jgi:hypothetical protein